jgi:integrase
MKWYGQPMDEFRIKVPRALPQYVEDAEIDELMRIVGDKRSYKRIITRDKLMLELYLKTGMRRGELAGREIHDDFLIVRKGKVR